MPIQTHFYLWNTNEDIYETERFLFLYLKFITSKLKVHFLHFTQKINQVYSRDSNN